MKTFSTARKTSESSFLRSLRRYKIPRGIPSAEALIPGVGKLAIYVQFSTDIAVYPGKGARYADDYDETVMGSHWVPEWCVSRSRIVSKGLKNM